MSHRFDVDAAIPVVVSQRPIELAIESLIFSLEDGGAPLPTDINILRR
jgi:hypothetical protein